MGEVSDWSIFLLLRLEGCLDVDLLGLEEGSSLYFDDDPVFDISVSLTILFSRLDFLGNEGEICASCCVFCLLDLLGAEVGVDGDGSCVGLDSGSVEGFRFLEDRAEVRVGCGS